MTERHRDRRQLYGSGLGPAARWLWLKLNSLQEIKWAKVGQWCSAGSQALGNTSPGLSLGGKGANFSLELHSLCHGSKVGGSVYCPVSPSQLHLSDEDQLLPVQLRDADTEKVFQLWCVVACSCGCSRCFVVWFWPFLPVCWEPFYELISIWIKITTWSFQSNLFGVHVHIAFEMSSSQELLKASVWRSPPSGLSRQYCRSWGGAGRRDFAQEKLKSP